ncbi:PREDICTED: uncharacterized protein LOC109236419 [Nicotiana attenuata]|uniref:uncharacterized protein LOC109236419 n=1 Tax=Nicotiana attenuata TaxID=49451 RepID=UPI00090466D9|nr:PREDICTED: uncharacterized protein LOC109236419 [Nicotiana attenuata]
MRVKGNDLAPLEIESVLLKKFRETLTKGALTWYSLLPEHSIDSLEMLADSFIKALAGPGSGPEKFSQYHLMESGGASQTNRKYHSGHKAPCQVVVTRDEGCVVNTPSTFEIPNSRRDQTNKGRSTGGKGNERDLGFQQYLARSGHAQVKLGFQHPSGLELSRGLDSGVIESDVIPKCCESGIRDFDTKEERMQKYIVKVQTLLTRFREWSITHIPREENAEVDALANLGSSTKMEGSDSDTVVQLMHSGKLPKDPKASRALHTKVARYSFWGGQLYISSFQGPLDRCLGASEANYVMREVHEGICGNYSGAYLLELKLVRAGYYCPGMEQDAKVFVQKCDKRQRHAPLVHQPTKLLHSVLSPWPFMKWEMDIVRTLPLAPGKVRFLLILTDYFCKWVEVGPYQKIGQRKVVDFLWESMICLFGIPKKVACDNGPYFIGMKIKKFLEDMKTKIITSSPYNSSINDQAESTNKAIIQNLKKRLEPTKGNWPEELLGVLWAYQTTTKSSTGETFFSLLYRSEALISIEMREHTMRYIWADEETNNKALLVKLELLDKHRDLAHIRMVAQK